MPTGSSGSQAASVAQPAAGHPGLRHEDSQMAGNVSGKTRALLAQALAGDTSCYAELTQLLAASMPNPTVKISKAPADVALPTWAAGLAD